MQLQHPILDRSRSMSSLFVSTLPSETGQRPVTTDDPMTRHNDGDGVFTDSAANGPDVFGITNRFSDTRNPGGGA